MTGNALEIFKPGTFTAMGGEQLTFSEGDVAAIAAGYDPAAHDAPLVVGHPKMDAPAYGWVKALRFAGGRLVAEPHKVDPAFAELVRAGRYRRISPSFYRPDHPRATRSQEPTICGMSAFSVPRRRP